MIYTKRLITISLFVGGSIAIDPYTMPNVEKEPRFAGDELAGQSVCF